MTATIEGLEAVTVHVRDIHKARKFYGEVLGLNEVQFDGKVGRAWFAIPGTSVLLRMHVYDPVSACEEISRRGGRVTDPPHKINPPGFTVTLAVIADPDGNEFVLRSPPTPTK